MQTVYVYSIGCKYIDTLIDLWFSDANVGASSDDNGIAWIDYHDGEPSAQELADDGFDDFHLAVKFDVVWQEGHIPLLVDGSVQEVER